MHAGGLAHLDRGTVVEAQASDDALSKRAHLSLGRIKNRHLVRAAPVRGQSGRRGPGIAQPDCLVDHPLSVEEQVEYVPLRPNQVGVQREQVWYEPLAKTAQELRAGYLGRCGGCSNQSDQIGILISLIGAEDAAIQAARLEHPLPGTAAQLVAGELLQEDEDGSMHGQRPPGVSKTTR